MRFSSTNNPSLRASLREAVLAGIAPDGGLFMPQILPCMPADFIKNIYGRSFTDISFDVARVFIDNEIPDSELRAIIDDAFNFPVPLVQLTPDIHTLELFHGPTLAFKDFGARFMARLIRYFLQKNTRELTILTATSGDTGSAVAHSFLDIPGVRVVVLYPSKKISSIQEQQLTTIGGATTALEVEGTFDDCQRLVKAAFQDGELAARANLSTANSINIARLIPQSFYYWYAYSQLPRNSAPVVISVPSGNFGHLTAGIFAKRMGLPIRRFVAATNINSVVPEYLETGVFCPRQSRATISNAMDVGNPSNFARMLALCEGRAEQMRKDVAGYYFSDDETRQALNEVHLTHGYTMDPHGAIGYLGLMRYLSEHKDSNGIFFETAHPAKFLDVVEPVIGVPVQIPERLTACLKKEKRAVLIPNDFDALKELLLQI